MAWPTGKPDTTAFDSQDDAISTARAELQTMSTSVGQMVDFIDTTGITSGQALVYDSVNDKLVVGDVGGDVVEDTTPQLGGDLDLNGFAIIDQSDSTGSPVTIKSDRIVIEPSGGADSAGDEQLRIEKPLSNIGVPLYSGNAWRISIGNYSGSGASPPSIDFIYSGHLDGSDERIVVNGGDSGISNPWTVEGSYLRGSYIDVEAIDGTGNVLDINGTLNGYTSFNEFKIMSQGLTAGKVTIYNDNSEESFITIGEGDIIIAPSQDSANKGTVDLQIPTSTSASAGAQTLPSNPVGFLGIKVNGTDYKVPYYNT